MNKHFKKLVLFLLIGALPFFAFSQKKIEKEKRVKKRDVPSEAIDWLLDSFEDVKKVKWYQEISNQGLTYEAKFWRVKKFHSVEFDSLGGLQDVEIEMELEELEESVKGQLLNFFESEFENYKINRIQIQYSGDSDDVEDFFDEDEIEGVLIRYEIEFSGKIKNENIQLWEGLFDQFGKLISKRQVEIRIMDNLIF